MADSTSSFDSRTMESIVVEDSSLNQSQDKECTSTGSRPAPTMVPVVFDKDNTSGKKEGRPIYIKSLHYEISNLNLVLLLCPFTLQCFI